jgi:DNA modification methylase
MGKFGRNRSNVWTYAGANTLRSGRMDDLAAHPTVKPLRLVADALKDVTAPGEIVLDSFAGSGTTILAAERVGRRACALEIDPKYANVAVRRWQAATGRDAIHPDTGLTFDELQRSRAENDSAAP